MFGRIAIAGRCTPARNAVLERWADIGERSRRWKEIIDLVPEIESKSRGHVGSLSQSEASLPASTTGSLPHSRDWAPLVLTSP